MVFLYQGLFYYFFFLMRGFRLLLVNSKSIARLRGSAIVIHRVLVALSFFLRLDYRDFNQYLFGGEVANLFLASSVVDYAYSRFYNLRRPIYSFSYFLGCDGLSIGLLFLSAFLFFLCLIYMPETLELKYQKEFYFNFYLLHIRLYFAFVVVDLFLFYIAFELVLIPLFYLIGRYGSGQRRIRAAYLFFFYTMLGSLGRLFSLIYMIRNLGTTNLHFLLALNFYGGLPFWYQFVFFLCFFVRMSVKVPLFPVHLWLPEAHVEAPTVGSVLLAGILLKLGTYGFFRFVFMLFFPVVIYCQNFFVLFLTLGYVLVSFSTIRQRDMKRVIAYSSVGHMAMVILGLFFLNRPGVYGSLFLMFSHGFISSALFFLVGVVYSRYHTRLINYFSGLRVFMPYFAFFFLYFSLANMRFPGTAGFIGEFLIVVSAARWNYVIMLLLARGMFLNRVYSLWLRNRILFGLPLSEYIVPSVDLVTREFVVLGFLFIVVLFLGFYPMFLFNILEGALSLCFISQ